MSLKQVDGGLDMTGESLRVLCRAYPAQQLTALGESITELGKRSEAAAQRSRRILRTLRETLLHNFNGERESFCRGPCIHGHLLPNTHSPPQIV